MNASAVTPTVSLTSTWFIKPGYEEAADAALRELAIAVEQEEPDTLTYLVNRPFRGDPRLQSLPPDDPLTVLFFETYRNADAFDKHVNGAVFTSFLKRCGQFFIQKNGQPFTFVEFLETRAGFVRTTDVSTASAASNIVANHHPSVMFEVIGRDQGSLKSFYASVFGWNYETGASGFAYVPFPAQLTPLLGGIGQTQPKTPGFEPGTNFYLRVDDLEAAIERAVRSGGSRFVEPTSVDGYTFAMVKDPEGNAIGLIKPF
ncbi:VOC family protein [Trinickia dinghuensis]|uniref:VOC family protein n=1 Tax=Trinickia dinghuensis TaxID=2291023 RepID=A0A3D8JYC9_9BURK|nr:VOC family protein [Trinickia dinghuensis]RDU98009.1 VOC family protein [Trinickia dinghuensis]